jgi:hypothetical protein
MSHNSKRSPDPANMLCCEKTIPQQYLQGEHPPNIGPPIWQPRCYPEVAISINPRPPSSLDGVRTKDEGEKPKDQVPNQCWAKWSEGSMDQRGRIHEYVRQ